MSDQIHFDLQKKSAAINSILLTKGVKNAPVMRVAVALDVSGSMAGFYRSGAVQEAFNQLMGVSVKFDDNGELDVFKFDHNCSYVGTSKPTKGDYDQFIKTHRIGPEGGTDYEPIVKEAMKFFFDGASTSAAAPTKKGFFGFGKSAPAPTLSSAPTAVDDTPVLMMILTDGEPGDRAQTERAMAAAASQPIYFHMVGIGGERRSFPTIAHLADKLDNVGEVYLPRLHMSDDEIYGQLICDELIQFVAKFAHPQQATA